MQSVKKPLNKSKSKSTAKTIKKSNLANKTQNTPKPEKRFLNPLK